MKKLLLCAISCILAACCALFVACDNTNSIAGTYKFESMTMTMSGETVTIAAGEEYAGMTVTEDFYIIEIKDDNTFVMTMTMGTESESYTGTWSKNENTLSLTAEGETIEATIDGNKITMAMSTYATIVLKK